MSLSRSHVHARPRRSTATAAGLLPLLVVGLVACSKPDAPGPGSAAPTVRTATVAASGAKHAPHPPGGIAWRDASNDAEVDAAFAVARRESKPVFVYWGAVWCPPCNQVKATLFNRQDFIERSRAFVPVYVDGDSPGAQKLGARFHVSGYPTMVLFTPQGTELTRLPGEVDPERYTQVLTLGMNADRPVREVLRLALGEGDTGRAGESGRAGAAGESGRAGFAGEAPRAGAARDRAVADARSREVAGERGREPRAATRPLGADDWRLLAFYSWDTDEQQLVPKARVGATLAKLAAACPPDQAEAATRLRLKALAAAESGDVAAAPPAARQALQQVLADAEASRRVLDVLTNGAAEIVRAVAPKDGDDRGTLLAAFDAALQRFEADTTISRADRIAALTARVDLVRIDTPKPDAAGKAPPAPPLPEALLADIREQTARADREITDGYERQAVITACAYLLEQAGLGAESDTLLKANLAKSHSPYYLMSELAGNAKARGDTAEALHWYEEAFMKSEGPATRLQWGASYLNALVELAPQDEARIEQAASQVFAEAGKAPDAFYERSGRSLKRVGAKLAGWNAKGAHAAVVARLQTQLDGVCGGLPEAEASKRAGCAALLRPAVKPAA